MTYEEAIEQLRKMKPIGRKCAEACDMAIEALDKQIPKKPIHNEFDRMWYCSECGSVVGRHQYYCWSCGQHLDWSEE